MNRLNLNPDIWGSHAWFFLESIVISYPDNPSEEMKKNYIDFFKSIGKILPCEICRIHFTEFIDKNPLTNSIISSKKLLINWILDAHNNVNNINNKKKITLDEFNNYYQNKYNNYSCITKCTNNISDKINVNNTCKKNNYQIIINNIINIIIIICLIYFYKKYQHIIIK